MQLNARTAAVWVGPRRVAVIEKPSAANLEVLMWTSVWTCWGYDLPLYCGFAAP